MDKSKRQNATPFQRLFKLCFHWQRLGRHVTVTIVLALATLGDRIISIFCPAALGGQGKHNSREY
jgi:hypothetical protein